MKMKRSLICAGVAFVGVSVAPSTWAVDMGAMKQKVETVKDQAGNVKKEAGETTQSAKEMKAKDALKNAGETKEEGMKLKDAATGK